jgi:hypothetical protein
MLQTKFRIKPEIFLRLYRICYLLQVFLVILILFENFNDFVSKKLCLLSMQEMRLLKLGKNIYFSKMNVSTKGKTIPILILL